MSRETVVTSAGPGLPRSPSTSVVPPVAWPEAWADEMATISETGSGDFA